MPADFSKFGAFEMAILALIAGALHGGVKLPAPRIALVLGLLHMALSHVRNVEIFALLLPIVVLAPVASQFALRPAWRAGQRADACHGGGDSPARRLDMAAGGQNHLCTAREASRRRRPSMR